MFLFLGNKVSKSKVKVNNVCYPGEEPKRSSLDSRPSDARDNRSSFGGNSRNYDRGGRRDDRDRDRDRDNDRGYDSRYPRRDRGESLMLFI